VLCKNADEILNFMSGEEHLGKIIAASGIKVITAGSSVSDLALHYLNCHSIAVLKVLSKFELRLLCCAGNSAKEERRKREAAVKAAVEEETRDGK